MLPPFLGKFAKRKPEPPKCTDENVSALLGRIIRHENNSPPGTYGAQWISDELRNAGDPTPDEIACRGEGLTYKARFGECAKYTFPEDKT